MNKDTKNQSSSSSSGSSGSGSSGSQTDTSTSGSGSSGSSSGYNQQYVNQFLTNLEQNINDPNKLRSYINEFRSESKNWQSQKAA